jgi:hypothetical protein
MLEAIEKMRDVTEKALSSTKRRASAQVDGRMFYGFAVSTWPSTPNG